MSLPTITQTWTHSVNNRYTFVSVIGATGDLMYRWSQFLATTMGWTVKGSCDGTTGAMDGVNRITDATKWGTRFNGTTSACSWIVLTDGAGINWCYSFNSSADDVVRLAHSTGGNYIVNAGGSNRQPTATDECFDAQSPTWVNATASLDRIWHFSGTSDKKMARLITCRAGAVIAHIQTEKFNDSLVAPATFSLATGGGTVGCLKGMWNVFQNPNTAFSSVDNGIFENYQLLTGGALVRVHTNADNNLGASRSGELPTGCPHFTSTPSYYSSEKPALQGSSGELLFPISMFCPTASLDGKVGNVIDMWFAWTNNATTPAQGDTFGSLQLFTLGSSCIVPWDGATPPVLT